MSLCGTAIEYLLHCGAAEQGSQRSWLLCRCPEGQVIVAFQLLSEPDQGAGGDDTGANNFAAVCGRAQQLREALVRVERESGASKSHLVP